MHKSQRNARAERYRYTDVSNGADDDNALVTTKFEKTNKLSSF